jgi:hypothetical protein
VRGSQRALGSAFGSERAADITPAIKQLQASSAVALPAIAAGLDERGIPAARGGKWSATQVMRLLEACARSDSSISALRPYRIRDASN